MKSTKITELPIIPHEYDLENYERVDYISLTEGMTCDERKFVHGLIRYYEPKNILEIGVAGGNGSVNILNSLSGMDSALVSIDIGTGARIGSAVKDRPSNWRLITGADPSEVMESLDMKFEFCVIDALHIHPGESFNFISVLPWLADGAIVVVHDTSAFYQFQWTSIPCLAPRILFSSVCADKEEPDISSGTGTTNICAFQITQDTRKYIQNVFDALLIPWGKMMENVIPSVRGIVEKYYEAKLLTIFDRAVEFNRKLDNRKREYELFCKMDLDDLIFYGAGVEGKKNLRMILEINRGFTYKIWDINADNIKQIHGIPVTYPDYDTRAKPGQAILITIKNDKTAEQVRSQFEPLGYTVYHGVSEYVRFAGNK